MPLVLVLSVLVTATVAALLARRQLHQRNRVDPTSVQTAPLGWLWSPLLAARLHRRLIAAAAVARLSEQRKDRQASTAGADRLDDLARSVRAEAAATDARLIRSAALRGAPRRQAVRDLGDEVRAVEHAASSWFTVARTSDARTERAGDTTGLGTVQAELDLLAEAQRQLDDLDAGAGLVNDPTRVATTGDVRPRSAEDHSPQPGWGPNGGSIAFDGRLRGPHQAVEDAGGGTAVE